MGAGSHPISDVCRGALSSQRKAPHSAGSSAVRVVPGVAAGGRCLSAARMRCVWNAEHPYCIYTPAVYATDRTRLNVKSTYIHTCLYKTFNRGRLFVVHLGCCFPALKRMIFFLNMPAPTLFTRGKSTPSNRHSAAAQLPPLLPRQSTTPPPGHQRPHPPACRRPPEAAVRPTQHQPYCSTEPLRLRSSDPAF